MPTLLLILYFLYNKNLFRSHYVWHPSQTLVFQLRILIHDIIFFHTSSSLCVKYIATAIYLQEIFESVYSLQETRKNIYDIVFSGDNAFTSVRFILCVTHKVN